MKEILKNVVVMALALTICAVLLSLYVPNTPVNVWVHSKVGSAAYFDQDVFAPDWYGPITRGGVQASNLVIPNKNFVAGGTITAALFNANYVAIENTVNGQLDDDNLINDGITGSLKIKNATVDLAAMASASVDSDNIVDDTIASGDILLDTILAIDIATNAVGPLELNDSACLANWNLETISGNLSNAVPNYCDFVRNDSSGRGFCSISASFADSLSLPKDMSFGTMHARVIVAPGAGMSWIITLRDDGSDTAVTCTIANTATACGFAATAVAFLQASLVEVKVDPVSTPNLPSQLMISICASPDN